MLQLMKQISIFVKINNKNKNKNHYGKIRRTV